MAGFNVIENRMGVDDYRAADHLLNTPRRPEHVSLFRSYQLASYCTSMEEMNGRWRGMSMGSEFRQRYAQLEVNRDIMCKATLKDSDTVLFFAGPEFCDLLAATDMPPVVDLTILQRIGNHSAMVLFHRNIPTGTPDDAIVSLFVHITEERSDDGYRRMMGSMVHVDESTSSFQYKFTEEHPGLATVSWTGGFNSRDGGDDVTTEQRILSNVLGLLAAQSLTQITPWAHYTKADRTAAVKGQRKLGKVNVITLQRKAQQDLDEHHEAVAIDRDGWWPVRGHFRLQAWGPNRANRRLTYIQPCVKGNREGPNIGRIQVHQTV